jgi:hypothetical protein
VVVLVMAVVAAAVTIRPRTLWLLTMGTAPVV